MMGRNYFLLLSAIGLVGGCNAPPPASQEIQPTAAARQIQECSHRVTRSYAKYVTNTWQNKGDKDSLILYITSDPQYPRTIMPDGSEGSDEARSKSRLREVFTKIHDERIRFSYAPVLVNGDLTEGGHDDSYGGYQRSKVQELMEIMADSRGPLIFPGLGNHDLDNDCALNGCARDSICDNLRWVNEIPQITSWDYRYFEQYPAYVHQGSYAYSFDMGPYHIVQLQREPTFNRTAVSVRKEFWMRPALDWLEADLKKAKAEGKDIILNLHIRAGWGTPEQKQRFRNMIVENGVSAVFAGHLHSQLGRVTADKAVYGDVPVFQSGALLKGTYLRVELNRRFAIGGVQAVGGSGSELGGGFVLRNSPPSELPPLPEEDRTQFLLFTEKNFQGMAVCDKTARYPGLDRTPGTPGYESNVRDLAAGRGGAYWNCADDNARSAVILPSKNYGRTRQFCLFADQGGTGAKVCATIPRDHEGPIRIPDFDDLSASGDDARYLSKTGNSIDRDVSSTGYFQFLVLPAGQAVAPEHLKP